MLSVTANVTSMGGDILLQNPVTYGTKGGDYKALR